MPLLFVHADHQWAECSGCYRYLKLIGDQSIKETDVGIPEPSQEDVLFDIRGLAPELGKGALLLCLERLDIGGTQS